MVGASRLPGYGQHRATMSIEEYVAAVIGGIGNSVFHPADYAMLSHHVPAQRIARAFSVHTFSGLLGGAVAPATLLFLQLYVGWRGAIIAAGLLGLIGAVILMLQRDPPLVQVARPKEDESARPSGWQLLTSRPMLLNLVFFFLVSTIASGLTTYLVVALIDLQNAPVAVANTALSTIMFASAVGVLLGGLILTRTRRHVGLTYITLSVIGTVSLIVAYVSLDAAALIVMMILSGLASGVMSPSRDMMVRDITPPGSFGAVFGFLSNGFSLSGIVSPLLFGFLMDHGQARYVFVVVAASCLLCALAVTAVARSGPARSLPDPSPR